MQKLFFLLLIFGFFIPLEGEAQKLPVPRFVSMKSDAVNVRQGPSRDHDVLFTYKRAGWPIEIIAEFDNWRKVRDSEGQEGWIWHALLSGRRTALVAPWEKEALFPLYASPVESSALKAKVQSSVLVELKRCDTTWCEVTVKSLTGFMRQESLWGVYPDEKIEG